MHDISTCLLEAASTADVLSSLPPRNEKESGRAEALNTLASELREAEQVLDRVVQLYLLAEDDEVRRSRTKQ